MPYQSHLSPQIARLLMEQGNIAGQQQAQRGAIWGNAVQNIGNRVSTKLSDLLREKQEAPRRAMMDESLALDVEGKRRGIAADDRAVADQEQAKVAAEKVTKVNDWLTLLASAPDPASQQQAYQQGRAQLIESGIFEPTDAPEFFPGPSWVKAKMLQVLPAKERFDKLFPKEDGPKLRNVNPGEVVIDETNPQAGPVFTAPPAPAKPPAAPNVGSFEDYVTQRFGERPTAGQITQARKDYNQSDDRPRINVNMPSGLSPTMEANIINRLTTQWGQVAAPAKELDRQVGLMDKGLEAARRGDMAQGAQAVLVTFQKILDPTSVVRESEYMRSAAGQSLATRMQGAMERLSRGGAGVPLAELEKFAALAKEAANAQRAYLPGQQERIGKTADRYKIPRELIFESAPVAAPAAPAAAPASGRTYYDADGNPVKKP